MSTYLLIGLGVYVLLAALFGYIRGRQKTTVRLILVVCSAAIAFIAAKPLTKNLMSGFVLSDELSGQIGTAIKNSPKLVGIIDNLPSMLVAIVIFIALFFLIQLVMYIPQAFAFNKKEKQRNAVAALLGALCGFIVFACTLAPIVYVVNIAASVASKLPDSYIEDVVGDAEEETGISSEVVKILVEDAASKEGVTGIISSIGGGIVDSLTKTEIEGEKISLSDELESVADIAEPILEAAETIGDISLESEEDIQQLLDSGKVDEIIEVVEDNEVLEPIVDEVITMAVATSVPEEIVKSDAALNEVADVVNKINSGEDCSELINEALKETGYNLPESATSYIQDYVSRNFEGTDWTAESLRAEYEELQQKYTQEAQ